MRQVDSEISREHVEITFRMFNPEDPTTLSRDQFHRWINHTFKDCSAIEFDFQLKVPSHLLTLPSLINVSLQQLIRAAAPTPSPSPEVRGWIHNENLPRTAVNKMARPVSRGRYIPRDQTPDRISPEMHIKKLELERAEQNERIRQLERANREKDEQIRTLSPVKERAETPQQDPPADYSASSATNSEAAKPEEAAAGAAGIASREPAAASEEAEEPTGCETCSLM